MKKMKKLFAVILSLAMVLGMCMVTSAAPEGATKPQDTDSATITVNGVKTGATVKAFKIVEGNWNDNGFTGYSVIDGYTIADLSNPTAEEITTIANNVDKTKGTVIEETAEGSGVYQGTFVVGTYLILVTANGENDMTAYNPMVASVSYLTEDASGALNQPQNGVVNAGDKFMVGDAEAYAKSMNPDITKEITNPIDDHENKYGNDTAFGQAIGFEVNTAFPAYSDAYTQADFNIIDKLSKGLDLDADSIVVTVGGEVATKDNDYTVDVVKDNEGVTTLTISFTNTETNRYVISNKGDAVKVTYNAALNKDAGLNFDANTNTVKAEYTNNPTTNEKGETDEKRTYHYTFGIDAELGGNSGYTTGELFKTDEGETKITESDVMKTIDNPLPDAVFLLSKANDKYEKLTGDDAWSLEGKSTADGRISFRGLDAGYYVFEETVAPDGYSLDATVHKVYIEAKYNTDGTLAEYSITIDDKSTSNYKASYTAEGIDRLITVTDKTDVATLIKNTTLASLPSTGGIGTTIFTIGGCVIMIAAAALFFASRKKSQK